jgi:uncharacterized phage-associated protein
MSLGITANKEKNGALLAYIAKNIPDINLRKLLKMVYLIDEKFVTLRGFPLTWFDYYAWKKGPVALEVYNIKEGEFNKYVTCSKNESGKQIVRPILQSDFLVFEQMELYSPYEIGVIDDIIHHYKNKSADELSAITHEKNSLWSRTVNENNVTFVDGKSNEIIQLAKLNKGNPEKEGIYEDALWNMNFQALLNQKTEKVNVPAS